jgi:hypothetical protein
MSNGGMTRRDQWERMWKISAVGRVKVTPQHLPEFFFSSQYILQSIRGHSAIVLTVTINGMQEIHPVIYLLFNFNHTWLTFGSSFMRFLDHTQQRTTIGRTPLEEWSARRRDLYLTTHNTHNRQTSMPPVGFEPTIAASERPQTYALDCAATGERLPRMNAENRNTFSQDSFWTGRRPETEVLSSRKKYMI